MLRAPVAVAALALLAACGSGGEQTTKAAPTFDAAPRTLVAANLDVDALGPKIEGPRGTEVVSTIAGAGTVSSFVACPGELEAEVCEPEGLPEGTLYTYVHRVTLEESEDGADAASGGATLFRTTRPAAGFANVIGYSHEEAFEALGAEGAIRVQTDRGRLVWHISAGDGWHAGETLTFFWQSHAAPAGPEEAYLLEGEAATGTATGPFPADEPVDAAPAQ